MTAGELIDRIGADPTPLLALLGGTVAFAYVVGLSHPDGRGGVAPWKYAYAVAVYLACVPGVLAGLLTAYTILFLRGDLLRVDLLVYFAPILSMAATLLLIRRRVAFDEIPGFDRLAGLITMLALSFAIVFVLSRIFFGIFFFGSIAFLVAITIFVFSLLKWAAYMTLRRGGAPRISAPRF